MTHITLLQCIGVCVFAIGFVRMLTQSFFLSKHLNQSFKTGCIPFVTNIRLYKRFGLSKINIIGMVLRIAGFVLMLGILIAQYYFSLLQMTHMYGLLLRTYTPTDYTVLWNVLSWTGVALIIAGCTCRLLMIKKFSKYFSMTGFVNFLGMVEPGLYFAVMSISRKVNFIMNKSTRQMSQEEYMLYCSLSEE